ncbi:MAG: iron ABC transporter permease [Anaerolineales bacterium]|nr:iron ABC transporter permease [Anaerolineales bacterium]MCX7754531.1 iron ABC transporter permease [Anaerolineales bacterium]MDW8277232.1 iron ABC transporter permease [Anaerolineales bacterium]
MKATLHIHSITRRSWRVSLKNISRLYLVLGSLLFATFITFVLQLWLGEYPIAPFDVLNTLLSRQVTDKNYHFVVMELRLPRAIVAWMVGMALGASGAIIQGLTRNPLASPDLTGVSAGASAGAVTMFVFFPGAPDVLLPLAAFGGGIFTAWLLYLFAWRNRSTAGSDSPLRLILIGIGLSAVLSAFTSFALTFSEIWNAQRAMIWLTGTVYATGWDDVNALFPWLVVGLPLTLLGARDLNVLNLGDNVAQGLGLPLHTVRAFLLLLAVALAGVTVTVAGIMGFVGLIAPHLARRLVGVMHEKLIPTSALMGGFLLILADLIGRTIRPPTEIPAGIVISIVGVPFFLYLLWKREKA